MEMETHTCSGGEVDVSLQEVVSKLERENGELRGELNKYNNAQVIVLVIGGWGGGVGSRCVTTGGR